MAMWCLAQPVRFYDRGEGFAVCYAVDSGDTHLINSQAASVLAALGGGALQEGRLLESLLKRESGAVPSLQELQSLLSDLAAADLVQAA